MRILWGLDTFERPVRPSNGYIILGRGNERELSF